jgi:hypothetical protein
MFIPNVSEIALLISKNAAGQQRVVAHDPPDPQISEHFRMIMNNGWVKSGLREQLPSLPSLIVVELCRSAGLSRQVAIDGHRIGGWRKLGQVARLTSSAYYTRLITGDPQGLRWDAYPPVLYRSRRRVRQVHRGR